MHKPILLSLALLLLSCENNRNQKTKEKNNQEEMFTVLSSKETGIHFFNELKETVGNNGLFYEYYYNGGGVAVADFNNDNLVDIYFVNCTKSNQLYLNQGGMKFKDVTKQASAEGGYGFGTGVTVVDINNDGLMDIYYSKSGKIQDPNLRKNELLINKGVNSEGIPVFENQAEKYGLDIPNFTTQATFFDYDKDGDLDMFLINHGIEMYDENKIELLVNKKSTHRGNRLYKNDNGKFIDVTEEAGIINTVIGFGLGVSVSDLNNDGWPDVYVGNDFSEKDFLYLNNQDGTFKEVSLKALRHVSNFSMGCDVADINNDGFFDILTLDMMSEDNFSQKTSMSGMKPEKFYKNQELGLHQQYMYNALQLNRGIHQKTNIPMFSDIAQIAGVSSTDWSWGPLIFDMNNNGFKDIFISNGIKRDFRNNDFIIYRKKKQAEVIKEKKIEVESYVKDILSEMPKRKKENYFYINNKDLTFSKINIKQMPNNSNGAAYADFDNDGDIDIVVNNSADTSFVYRNNTVNSNYLKIKLKGNKDNLNAIGAKIELTTKSGKQYVENYFTRGFQSAMADAVHFGLADDKVAESIKVIWNDETYTLLNNIKSNQLITIDYQKSKREPFKKKEETSSKFIFKDITKKSNIDFKHEENKFNDYEKETLLPHRMSQLGPALAVSDADNDGLEDFFVGGAKGQSSYLYFQNKDGKFVKLKTPFDADKEHEDVGAIFFDADNDGDLDLYVISGGTEKSPKNPYYRDRFYENKGNRKFVKNTTAIPNIQSSGLRVSKADFDNDGDLDLFIGTRVKPGFYGQPSKSYLLENRSKAGNIKFVDVTKEKLADLEEFNMITSSTWADINNDGFKDLITTSEWGAVNIFINNNGIFKNETKKYGLDQHVGWWSSVEVVDIDNDGDLDIIAGNLGLNYKYKATFEKPFYLYLNDFDNNGTEDIVLGYSQENHVFPVRGRECSSEQMPFIKKKFKTYNDFGAADINQIYGDKLNEATKYKATNFATSLLINEGGKFTVKPFDNQVQFSSVNRILIDDLDGDSYKEILFLGNLHESEVETPRNDASYGVLLSYYSNDKYNIIPNYKTNLWAYGNIKYAEFIKVNGKKAILIANNNGYLELLELSN